jgi:AcrR family transcriptional regulator
MPRRSLAVSSRPVGSRGSRKEHEDPGQLRPLHGGRHNIPAEVLAHNQRERLLAALVSCVAEHGYNATTITQITGAASVSRRTFYEHFAGKEECFVAAYEALDTYLGTLIGDAVNGESEWPDQVAAAFVALIDFLASRPNFARIYLVEAAVVGEAMAAARQKTAQRFVALLEPGRRYRDVDPGIEEGLVGGIVTLLSRRVLGGEAAELARFAPGLLEFALAPYLGGPEARQAIARHTQGGGR